jgi:hypothetical protein
MYLIQFHKNTHMFPPPDVPKGFHCAKFDTGLLKEIIMLEIDIAVRRLYREKNVSIKTSIQHDWMDAILKQIEEQTLKDLSIHCMLPGVLQKNLKDALNALIRQEIESQNADQTACEESTMKSPPKEPLMSGVCLFARFVRNTLFPESLE